MTISKDSSPPRFAALRNRDFSLLWTGMLVSTVGSQMQLTAVNWHVFELLRGSTYTLQLFGGEFALGGEALGLGTLGLVRVIPIVLFALIGGVLADTLDRRRLLLVTQAAATLFAGILAYLSLRGEASVTAIYLL
ncbi:MAG: MFS transporter, partial [Anaerolineae bacterium]